jgi:hypothetical protein
MKKIYSLIFILSIASQSTFAQLGPEITSWIINTTGQTGYAGILSNVQVVQYSTNNVYVSCTDIPGYAIGPWPGNPNVASNQNFVYKITRNPVQNIGTPTAVGLGHTGVWINGVSIYNVSDGQSYQNQGIWNRNALYWEGSGFDDCLGHPQQAGEYHHHVNPECLYDFHDSLNHSPIIGFAFDGFPVYGGYAYQNTDGTGPIVRIKSSYVLSSATSRTNGPAVGGMYPAGCFIEDYIYTAGSGDLDQRNGRYCVTPEYPNGIYAYFVTLDASSEPAFPYTFFGSYYGIVQPGNIGPGSGHNTISEPTTVYNPTASVDENERAIEYVLAPNPAQDYTYIFFTSESGNNISGNLYDINGRLLQSYDQMHPGIYYLLDMADYHAGLYFLHLTTGTQTKIQKIVKVK